MGMELQQALDRIAELEAETKGLQEEKTALLRKRDELLSKVRKFKSLDEFTDEQIEQFKQFQASGIESVEELLKLKDTAPTDDLKNQYEQAYLRDKKALETRLKAIEDERAREKEERERERETLQKERLKSAIISEFSKPEYSIFDPEQLYMLAGSQLRLDESGNLIAGDEYKTLGPKDFIEELKQQPRYQNQFKARDVNGSGVQPSIGIAASGQVNPWKKESFNLTHQGQLIRDNPQKAERLMAAAGVQKAQPM